MNSLIRDTCERLNIQTSIYISLEIPLLLQENVHIHTLELLLFNLVSQNVCLDIRYFAPFESF